MTERFQIIFLSIISNYPCHARSKEITSRVFGLTEFQKLRDDSELKQVEFKARVKVKEGKVFFIAKLKEDHFLRWLSFRQTML